jgi:DNA-binding SARP family transcriptional activator
MGESVRFRLLGPLEVLHKRQPVSLGGTKQKATLAYLLLHANQVVSISQLLNALWPVDTAPLSARKILQNSVSSLRRGPVPGDGAGGTPTLVTAPPGYKLSVDSEDIDLHVFHNRVTEGRRLLANAEPAPAAQVLREALELWRGPILADLSEAGITWLEVAIAQNARWDAMEDYFEAELACGRHMAVLGELEAMVETNPVRERAAGQLMLALYRSGRQADALNTYSRVRVALVEELGLEPGRELRTLQQSILAHDPSLLIEPVTSLATVPRLVTVPFDRTARPVAPVLDEQPSPGNALVTGRFPYPDLPPQPSDTATARRLTLVDTEPVPTQPVPPEPEPAPLEDERKTVSVLLVRTVIEDGAGGADTPGVDRMLAEIAQLVRSKAEHFTGTVSATIGSVSLTVFEPRTKWVDAAKRAVLAALSIGEELRTTDQNSPTGVSFHAAVVTGQVLVRHSPDGVVTITGTLLDRCHSLLQRTEVSEIRVCETTREATEPLAMYRPGDVHDWRLQGIRKDYVGSTPGLPAEREFELSLLLGLLERTGRRSAAHLVTVLGEAGTGKSRLLSEFERRAHGQAHITRFQAFSRPAGASGPDTGAIHALQRELIKTICGIRTGDSPSVALGKATDSIHRLIDDPAQAERMITCVAPYLDPQLAFVTTDPAAELAGWRRFLARTEFTKPFVLIVDDLHWADDSVLDFVAELADTASHGPLLVVTSARSELLGRRPTWGGGKRHITTITLEALSDAAVDELVENLVEPHEEEQREPVPVAVPLPPDASPRHTGWRRYIRDLLDIGTPIRRPPLDDVAVVRRLRPCETEKASQVRV